MPYMMPTIEQEGERYAKAAHAMQSGVKMIQNFEHSEMSSHSTFEPSDSPKHLRVGVNSTMCDQTALVKLLISKGHFTQLEYTTAIADEMELEVKRYEKRIQDEMPGKATFKLH